MAQANSPFLRVSGLTKHFREQSGWLGPILNGAQGTGHVVKAVDDVSFAVEAGETFGFLGESGCGKTTLARTLLRLTEPTAGEAWLDGQSIFEMSPEEVRTTLRPRVRMIFQHPDAVLNPAYTVFMTLNQALRLHTDLDEAARRARARELLEQVNLPASYLDKYPDALSGGQKRRVGICRALATEPDALVADEPFSGLDISLQEQIVDLMQEIQDAHDLTTLLISHDTGLMRHLCDRIGIMQKGRLVEVLPTGKMTPEHCEHPYAESLLRTHFNVRRQSA